MKKKLAVVLAAFMMLSCTTVLAAPSIDTNVKVETAKTESGVVVAVTAETTPEAKAKLETNKAEAIKRAETSKAEVVAMVSLTGTVPAGEKVDVTVSVASAKKGETFKVEHLKSSDNTWETLNGVSNADGYVTIKGISEFSPFYIAKVDTSTNANSWLYYVNANPYGAATLPKTGAVAVLPVVAMACLAGAVVCGRKEK